MSYKSDIEIAREAKKQPIQQIGEKLGIGYEDLLPFGHDKAKISAEFIKAQKSKKDGKLIIKDDKYEKRERGSDEEMDDRRSVRSGRTARTSRTSKSGATMKTNRTSKTHASGKTIVKTKGTKKLEPFAYWPMDRKMLNRRAAKRKDAKKGLLHVVKSKGAKKGKKSKR